MRAPTGRALLALMTAVAVFAAGCTASTARNETRGDAPPLVRVETPAGGTVPRVERTVPLEPGVRALDLADVTGDAEPEVILARDAEIEIRSLTGDVLRRVAIAAPHLVYGFSADLDDDGKADLVLGSRNDSTSRVRVVNGRGRMIAQAAFGSLVDGVTRPRFERRNAVYFTAGSAIGSTPRIIGRFEPGEQRIEWLRSDGVVPAGLVYAAGPDVVGVHTRGTSRDLPDARAQTDTPSPRSAVLAVDPDGGTRSFVPLGEPVVEGAGGADQISLVETHPVRLADGTVGAVVTASRESGVFGGSSRVLLVDESGGVVAEHEGPPASRASLVVDAAAGDGGFRVAVVWSSTGVLEVLDERLRHVASVRLPGAWHDARIEAAADLDGDGALDYLIVDMDRLAIASPAAGTVETLRCSGPVRGVRLASDARGPVVAVLASDLHVVRPGAGDADGSAGAAWREEIPQIGPPAMSVKGELAWPDGRRPVPRAEMAMPDGWRYLGFADVAGDETPEVVIVDTARSRVRMLSPALEPIAAFAIPAPIYRVAVTGDLNGDGKADLVVVEPGPFYAALAVDGTGETLFRTPLTYGTNMNVSIEGDSAATLWLSVVTGHLLAPRGVYALDGSTGAIRFFSPTAGFPGGVTEIAGQTFISIYTPANGAVLERADGQIDRDDRLFVHVLDHDGEQHPWAGPAPVEPPRGTIRYFALDAEGDGTPEPYLRLSRDPTYNPGPPGVYRVGGEGRLELVAGGPEDDHPAVHTAWVDDQERLVVHYQRAGIVRVFAPDLDSWTDERVGEARLLGVRDGDADGRMELWYLVEGRVESARPDGTRLGSISWPDGPIERARLESDPAHPADYLIVEGGGRLGVVELRGQGRP